MPLPRAKVRPDLEREQETGERKTRPGFLLRLKAGRIPSFTGLVVVFFGVEKPFWSIIYAQHYRTHFSTVFTTSTLSLSLPDESTFRVREATYEEEVCSVMTLLNYYFNLLL